MWRASARIATSTSSTAIRSRSAACRCRQPSRVRPASDGNGGTLDSTRLNISFRRTKSIPSGHPCNRWRRKLRCAGAGGEMVEIDLTGRVAIVTGAGQGLGAAIAQALHRAGAVVIVNYFADPDGANQPRAQAVAAALGARAMDIAADVRSPEQLAAMVERVVTRFARLDIVVNNAGIIRDKTLKN